MGCSSSSGTKTASKDQQAHVAQPQIQAAPTITETTPEERALVQLKLIFDSIAADEQGTVSKDELANALEKDQNLGALIKDAGFNVKYNVLSELDTSKDGCVSWQEFQGNLKEKETAVDVPVDLSFGRSAEEANEKVLTHLKAIFESIDANVDSAVGTHELAAKLKADLDQQGLTKDGTFAQQVEDAGFNPSFHTLAGLDTKKPGLITWGEFEANLRTTAKAELKDEDLRDVMAVGEPEDKDDGSAPVCGCW